MVRPIQRLRAEPALRLRLAVVAVALLIGGVPTAFTVLAQEANDVSELGKVGVLLLWVPLLAISAWFARLREERDDALLDSLFPAGEGSRSGMEEEADWATFLPAAEEVVGADLIEYLLARRWPGIREDYRLTLYIFDEDEQLLLPTYPRSQRAEIQRRFAPGHGATGSAWEQDARVVVRGDDVSSAAYGLTEAQSHLFRRYRAVAAQPVKVNGVSVGVLSAISARDDDYLLSGEAENRLLALATALGIILEGSQWPGDTVTADRYPEVANEEDEA